MASARRGRLPVEGVGVGVVSGCGWQVGTHLHLVPFLYPPFSLLLVAVGCCSRRCGRRPFPGGRGGGVVEGSG